MIFRAALVLVAAFSISATACGETQSSLAYVVPSTGVQTSELQGTFMIRGDRGKLTASAAFSNAATGDIVQLAGADAVYCDGVKLEASSTWLGVEMPRKAAGEVYEFELRRAGESVRVRVLAIDAVKLLAPAAAAELRQTAPLEVTWTPAAGTSIDAQLFANCAMSNAKNVAESGSIMLPGFTPVGLPGGPQNAAPPPCSGTVSLVRSQQGEARTALSRAITLAEETDRVPVRVVE